MAKQPLLNLVPESNTPASGFKRYAGELWTAEQREMHSLHYAVSYPGSFKPELPNFCIKRYSRKGEIVLDPFSGRGTTALQANLLGRVAWASDLNPLAVRMTQAKCNPVGLDEIVLRLNLMNFYRPVSLDGYGENFQPFYHPDTYRELVNLRAIVRDNPDRVNQFIELLAISRLHGHSSSFFSTYSFPQVSVSPDSQRALNTKRHQEAEYRAIAPRIIKKAAHSLRDGFTSEFVAVSSANDFAVSDARNMTWAASNSVDLVVTAPPFLDAIDYRSDNWLEHWFSGINPDEIKHTLSACRDLAEWKIFIREALSEMLRVLKPRAYAVIAVGEVVTPAGAINLDELVVEAAFEATNAEKRFVVEEVLINKQEFTKLSNSFRADGESIGNTTNRLVVLRSINKQRRKKSARASS